MMKFSAIFLAMIVFSLCSVQGTHQMYQPAELANIGLSNCKCDAAYDYRPICASNGVTYTNLALMKCAKRCLNSPNLEKVHDGRCK